MDLLKLILLLMLYDSSSVHARTLRLQRAANSKMIEKWLVNIELGNKLVCTGVILPNAWILTLADCIDKEKKPTKYSVIFKDGSRQKVIREEKSTVGQTLSLLNVKVTRKTKRSKFPPLSDSLPLLSRYDYHLYNMDQTNKVIAGDVDFVSNNICKKNGVDSITGKGNKCFKANVDEGTKCTAGSPIFGSKKTEILLQGVSTTSSDACTSTPQYMISIQPHLAWINSFIIDCGAVRNIQNGKAVLDKGTTTVGATATIKCNPGYNSKRKKIVCLESGKWEQAKCKIKDCGSSLTVSDGTIEFGTTTVGSIASVSCNVGYLPKKDAIECLTSGSWETPFCDIKDCGSSLSVSNGNIKFGTTTVGSIASVTCTTGYSPKKDTIKCLKTGIWETPLCALTDCGSSLSVSNGNITFGTTTVGSIASVTCTTGYSTKKDTIKCLKSGSWETPICAITDCGSSLGVSNGNITFGTTTVGSIASVTCTSGYSPKKDAIECLKSGSWETPICAVTDCGSSLGVSNGNITFGTTTVGSIASVTCTSGYSSKKDAIECLKSGSWETPICVRTDCGSSVSVINGKIKFGTTTVGSIASVTCASGYIPKKDDIECLKSGRWETPICDIIDCGSSLTVSNGTLEFGTTTVGSIASVTCNAGYLPKKDTIECLKSGSWETPYCEIKDCGSSLSVLNGKVTFGKTTVGSIAFVTCNSGYIPKKKFVECLTSGSWETPVCDFKDIDECKKGKSNCDVNAKCTNTVGSFTCKCNSGFFGDGVTCIDVNECETGDNNCDTNAQCTNTIGSYTCKCKAGFNGDGIKCEDINECKTGNDNCDFNAQCINNVGSFTCQCNDGFYGDGVICTDYAENMTDCLDLLNAGKSKSGVYPIYLWSTQTIVEVYCDMDTDGGGWTVFQKRFDGSLNFQRNISDFENGFGNPNQEYWMGLRYIQEMANQDSTTLRIHLTDVDDASYFREYENFYLKTSLYVLKIGAGSGTPLSNIYNTLGYHDGMPFTTYDSDNDKSKKKNCAITSKSGWWHKNCFQVNLNGLYTTPGEKTISNKSIKGIIHAGLKPWIAFKTSEMMMRRKL